MPYTFGYQVSDLDGNDYGHQEQSDGHVVTGKYHVLLPDGRVQTVTYTADHVNGYQAKVEYQVRSVITVQHGYMNQFNHFEDFDSYVPC